MSLSEHNYYGMSRNPFILFLLEVLIPGLI